MKKLIIVLCLLCSGCGLLQQVGQSGDPNDVIIVLDPNTIGPWLDAAYEAGQASQAIGIATGNPALVGGGVLLATIATIIGAGILRRK